MLATALTSRYVRIGVVAAVLGITALALVSGHVGQVTPVQAAPKVKAVYQIKGLGGDFTSASYTGPTMNPSCSGFGFTISASETIQHQPGSGDKATSNYGYVSYNRWDYCSGPYYYEYGYAYTPIDISGNQTSLGLSGEVLLSGWSWTPSGYAPISASATFDVDLNTDGVESYFGQNSGHYSFPGATYRYRSVGWNATATGSGSFVVDGDEMMSDSPDYSGGYISKNNSGQVEMFTY